VIEVLILSSLALRRTQPSCALSARARSDCRSMWHDVPKALSLSELAAPFDSQ